MNTSSAFLTLTRQDKAFQACIAFTQGELAVLSSHLGKLHPEEKKIYHSMKHDLRKKSYLLGRLSAKEALANLAGMREAAAIWIDSGVFHFPVVRCAHIHNIQVSISHCGQIGMSIAFPETHPMAIDLERISPDRIDAVLSQLTVTEKALLKEKSMDHIAGYTALFSMKEALSKVIRTGMMMDFNFFEIKSLSLNNGIMESAFSHFGQYKSFSFIGGDHVISITAPARTDVDLDRFGEISKKCGSAYTKYI